MTGEAVAIPAARISKLRNGTIYATHVLMRYGAPLALDAAIERAQGGRTVFVRREDVHLVLDALGVPEASAR